MPVAEEEVHVMLIEPKATLNTGEVRNERTVERLEKNLIVIFCEGRNIVDLILILC